MGLLGISVGRLVSDLFSGLTRWVGDGAAFVLQAVGHTLDVTTRPALGAGFTGEYSMMTLIGVTLAAPFLVLALIQAIARQDLGLLVRAAFVRLPAAVLLAAVAVELVRLCLAGTDELCVSMLHAAGSPARALFSPMIVAFTTIGGAGVAGALPFGGFAALLLAVLAALLALVLWLELAVRAAAVAVATLFLPLALSGLVWSATAHWARRLAETLAALVLSKFVIVAVLVLATSTLGSVFAGSGISGVVEGIALLLLAGVSPFSLLRLLPMIESGAMTHLEGQARRPLHPVDPTSPARRAHYNLVDLVGGLGGNGGGGGAPGPGPTPAGPTPAGPTPAGSGSGSGTSGSGTSGSGTSGSSGGSAGSSSGSSIAAAPHNAARSGPMEREEVAEAQTELAPSGTFWTGYAGVATGRSDP